MSNASKSHSISAGSANNARPSTSIKIQQALLRRKNEASGRVTCSTCYYVPNLTALQTVMVPPMAQREGQRLTRKVKVRPSGMARKVRATPLETNRVRL